MPSSSESATPTVVVTGLGAYDAGRWRRRVDLGRLVGWSLRRSLSYSRVGVGVAGDVCGVGRSGSE